MEKAKITIEEKKAEALKRMKLLKLLSDVIKDFEQNNRVYYSERQNKFFDGILYWLDNEPTWEKQVKDFEKKHNCLVYHAQLTHFEFGDSLALLFVSDNIEEWEQDKKDIQEGYAFSYVMNLDTDDFSEFGSIGITPKNGGVSRTY